jgi:hypothetical protein
MAVVIRSLPVGLRAEQRPPNAGGVSAQTKVERTNMDIKIERTLWALPLALALAVACNEGSTPDDAGGEPNSSGGKSTGGRSSGGNASTGGNGGAAGSGNAPECDAPVPPSWAAMGGFGGAYGEPEVELDAELTGNYEDEWSTQHQIGPSSWEMGSSTYHFAYVNNDEQWIVALNDSDNEYSPDLWSKFVFAEKSGVLYYCQSAYGASSFGEAYCNQDADASDVTIGCGASGFAWSTLEPVSP